MSAANKKIWVVVALSTVVGLVAAIYVARLVGEQSDRRIITSQVEDWAGTWAKARACLVGTEPVFRSASLAFFMHEATAGDDPERLKACDAYLRKLTRPGEESTGDATIEASWENIRATVKELAQAYAAMLDQESLRSWSERRTRLGTALDRVDEAYARLRADCKLVPAPPPGTDRPTELGAGTTVKAGEQALDPGNFELRGETLVIEGNAGGALTLAVVQGPDRVETYRISETAMRAADRESWGLWFSNTPRGQLQMHTGPLSAEGMPQGEGVVVVTTADASQDLIARMALGSDKGRAILYETVANPAAQSSLGLFMVRSTDGGATWQKPILLAERTAYMYSDFARRRFDVAWVDEANTMRWLVVRGDRLDQMAQPKRLFDIEAAPAEDEEEAELAPCLGEASSWWVRRGKLYHVAGESTAARMLGDVDQENAEGIARCHDEQVLLIQRSTKTSTGALSIRLCDGRACTPLMDVPVSDREMDYKVGLGKRLGPVVVTRTNRVLLLWRPAREPVPFVVPETHALRAIVEWQGTLHAIMATDSAIHVIPVPLSGGS